MRKFKPDIIHIHGIWKPIHIMFIIYAKKLNIPVILQPHGMLLEEALKTTSYLRFLIKLLILSIYKYLIKNISFIAVTNQEKKSILKYFYGSNVKIIFNPFHTNYKYSNKINKVYSFFGRINPHKNLDLIILSFIQAKLSPSWNLHIYGINDDKKYKEKCISIINKHNISKRIKFKKPIFKNELKLKIMSQSYCNILMSKSEILNLSVLESLSVGTKSIVNKNIEYPRNISNLIHYSKPQSNQLSKKIYNLSQNQINQLNNRKKLIKKFKRNYNFKNIEKKYLSFLLEIRMKKRKNYK